MLWPGRAVCLALALAASACASELAPLQQPSPPPVALGHGWERRWDDTPGAQWERIQLPQRRDGHDGAEFRLRLPAGTWDDPALFFGAVDSQFDATLDGAPLASYGVHPLRPPQITVGAPWHLVRLPDDYAGKELVIHATTADPYTVGPMPPVAIGARSDLLQLIIAHGLLPMLVGLIAFCAGLVALGLSLYRPSDRFHLAFALYAIAVGVGLVAATESKLLIWDAPAAWRYALTLARLLRPAALTAFAAFALARPPRWLTPLWKALGLFAALAAVALLVSFSSYAVTWRLLNLEFWLGDAAVVVAAALGLARRDRLAAPMFVGLLAGFGGGLAEILTHTMWTTPHLSWIAVGTLAELIGLASVEAELLARVYRELARHAGELQRKNLLLTEAERELQGAVAARDEFLSIASHELRTPLSALLLQLEVAARAPSAQDRAMASVRRQAERLTELVERLLDVARVRTRRLGLQYEEVELAALARDAVARFRMGLSQPELLQCAADAPVLGRWDRVRLEQVLSNLVSNALKFGEGKRVQVTVVGTPDAAVLTVADQGAGISPEDQARIFERFERGAAGRNVAGLGLGLWITRAIVVEHGGQITVESAPGAGAKFRVELPRGERSREPAGTA